jgi:LPXTG-motif cell wall-anchored protein
MHNEGGSITVASMPGALKERIVVMKTAGLIIFIVGFIMTLYTGFTYVTKEKVVDLGALEITKDNQHSVNWLPYVGIGVMVISGGVLVLGRKKSLGGL